MAADLQPVIDEMTAAKTQLDAGVAFFGALPALLQTKIDAALANGATAAQLQPVSDFGAQLKASADAFATAMAANNVPPTPAPTPAQLAKAKGK